MDMVLQMIQMYVKKMVKFKMQTPTKFLIKQEKEVLHNLVVWVQEIIFLEVQKVAEIHDEEAAKRMGIKEGTITILIHCGSRGFGHQVCSDYLTSFRTVYAEIQY